ncbi:hypothetical protein JVU11DRAFT_12677 [Chiua virens]|nr:hypothetical protein JVU11DRAFT_12677 [Chiua virens]
MISPYDLIGPVLPQALRLTRYQIAENLPENASDLLSENDAMNQMPSPEEERLLLSNANVVTALENVFSFTSKDRTSRTSKLSCMESVRFQRALYRAWLMSVLYGPRRFAPPKRFFNDSYEDQSKEWGKKLADLNKSKKEQKAFLQQYSSQELLQICKVARFLVLTAGWGVYAEGRGLGGTRDVYDWNGMFLFAGPHVILRCYEDATSQHLPGGYLDDDGLYTKFLTGAFDEIAKARKLDEPIGFVGTILDNINGEDDLCMTNNYPPHPMLTGSNRLSLQ